MESSEKEHQDAETKKKSDDGESNCCKLTYLADNQIHIRKIQRTNRLTCSREVGTTTSLDELDLPVSDDENFSSNLEDELVITGYDDDTGTGSDLLRVEETKVESCSDEEEEIASIRISDVEIDDTDNNNSVVWEKGHKIKLTSPAKLEPIFLGQEDVRNLLEEAREKGQSVAPKWQRQGITRINQFLINLEPFSNLLIKLDDLLGVKIENSKGGQSRLLFFNFWFVGLIVESLQPQDDLHEIGHLIHQLRTPIRRLYQLNSAVNDLMEESIKKFRHRILNLVNELDKPVYSDLLRMTPSPLVTNEDEVPLGTEFDTDLIQLNNPRPSTLCITSISTILLISCTNSKTQKVGQLTTKGKTYVVQGILSATQEILTGVHDYAKSLRDLFHSNSAKALKTSTKELVCQLKKMRKENGLRHINASRNFSNSVKLLESELLRTGRLIEKVDIGTKWILEALEQCLRQGMTWTPEPCHHELSVFGNMSRTSRLKEWFGIGKRKEITTIFHDFFGTKNFLEIFNSFQIFVPITKNRMKFLFPPEELETDFDGEVPPDPSTSSRVGSIEVEEIRSEQPSDKSCSEFDQILEVDATSRVGDLQQVLPSNLLESNKLSCEVIGFG